MQKKLRAWIEEKLMEQMSCPVFQVSTEKDQKMIKLVETPTRTSRKMAAMHLFYTTLHSTNSNYGHTDASDQSTSQHI